MTTGYLTTRFFRKYNPCQFYSLSFRSTCWTVRWMKKFQNSSFLWNLPTDWRDGVSQWKNLAWETGDKMPFLYIRFYCTIVLKENAAGVNNKRANLHERKTFSIVWLQNNSNCFSTPFDIIQRTRATGIWRMTNSSPDVNLKKYNRIFLTKCPPK